jgi:nucleotide-binding universal stress UspA family protein
MIKSILVPATGSDADEAAFAAALAVARPFAAHLDVLHVRVDAAEAAVAMATDTSGSALVAGLIERIEAEADEQEARARERFQGFCAREALALAAAPSTVPGPSAGWRLAKGRATERIVAYARTADLVVIGRPQDGAGVTLETLEATLIDGGRPLLLPGGVPSSGLPETVAIAWKPTREAAHAVAAAQPFLRHAKEIVILSVAEPESDVDSGADRLAEGLCWHGLTASLRRLDPGPDGAADALLAAAGELRALLVIGGYGHSRLREWIFGGVTQRILAGAEVPVLIAH